MLHLVRPSAMQDTTDDFRAACGFGKKAVGALALTVVLLLPTGDAFAGSVPTGSTGPATLTGATSPVYYGWGIFDPSHTLIASSGPNPVPNGWNATFTWGLVGGVAHITGITVAAPITAGIGTGYTVVVAGPTGPNTGSFDVVASGAPPPPTGVNGLTISPSSIAGGDTATGVVSINSIAPSGGVTVSLSGNSYSPYNYILAPSTVTIPQGRSITTFSLDTAGAASATIAATSGGATKTAGISAGGSPTLTGSVRVGQTGSVTPAALRSNIATWAIYGPTGAVIASSGGPVPTNGWNVTFSTYYNGQTYSIPSISVTAPAGAAVASNYAVTVAGPPGNNVGYFSVTY